MRRPEQPPAVDFRVAGGFPFGRHPLVALAFLCAREEYAFFRFNMDF
jgi:hypothetical protein